MPYCFVNALSLVTETLHVNAEIFTSVDKYKNRLKIDNWMRRKARHFLMFFFLTIGDHVNWSSMLNIKYQNNNPTLLFSYEKVLIQTLYNSSSPTQPWEEKMTLYGFMSNSRSQVKTSTPHPVWLSPTSKPTPIFGF